MVLVVVGGPYHLHGPIQWLLCWGAWHSLHVCVVQMRSPFGSWARMGAFVGCLSVNGAVVVRKWLLAPESTIAQLRVVFLLSEIVLSNDVWVGVELCVDSVIDALLINCLFLHKMFAPNRQYWYPW